MMTRDDVVAASGTLFSWLLAHASNLALLGVGVWFLVKPIIIDNAQAFIEVEVKKQVPEVVAEQVEKRFQVLEDSAKQAEQDREQMKQTQRTLIYQQGRVNEKLPELEGKLDSIIQMLRENRTYDRQ